MADEYDIKVLKTTLYFLPVETRVPLKFGKEVTKSVTCARSCIEVSGKNGEKSTGWGETPLSVAWVWPSLILSYEERHEAMKSFCRILASEWSKFSVAGHPMEISHIFTETRLNDLFNEFNKTRAGSDPFPWLAALVCCSVFDIALHDAYGNIHNTFSFNTYNSKYMNHDLSWYYSETYKDMFKGKYPEDYFADPVPDSIRAWHLVGGKDPVTETELTGNEPDDGYPVLLNEWIRQDGLKCLKIKLTGNDAEWDYRRLVSVGQLGMVMDVEWLSADFNCTVEDPEYVNCILDKLLYEYPRIFAMLLYVEQPFPYDLEQNRIDVHSVSVRKPLFMDESAHDWKYLELGRELGWTGVALKTCKTLTGALLSLCWAREHGMSIMVQDLTNPMIAMVPHVLLAAFSGTLMGVETNSMQFYPEASIPEQKVHKKLYSREHGNVVLDSIGTLGLGYRLEEIKRTLPAPELVV